MFINFTFICFFSETFKIDIGKNKYGENNDKNSYKAQDNLNYLNKKSFLNKSVSVGKYVILVTSLLLTSAEKAWPLVLYETVKFDVTFKEKVVFRAVSPPAKLV